MTKYADQLIEQEMIAKYQRNIGQDNDAVNHPSHYTDSEIEVIDYIEDKNFSYHLGNAVKYISRAGKKNPDKEVEDLKKAIWYIKRHIKNISGGDNE